jgi:DNA mismatch endonuclease (patch repair protein)
MTDVLSPSQRSYCMSRIRGKDTKPENVVRKGLFALGFRYRLHQGRLPGRPDLVLSRYKAVIFVNGCLWHGHGCALFQWPQTNREFWSKKISGNRRNDERNLEKLKAAGWRTLVVWECAIRGRHRMTEEVLIRTIAGWLSSAKPRKEVAGGKRKPTIRPIAR